MRGIRDDRKQKMFTTWQEKSNDKIESKSGRQLQLFPLISITFVCMVSPNLLLWWVFRYIGGRGGVSGRGSTRARAEDLLASFLFLLGMDVGLHLFEHVDPPQKNLPVCHEYPFPSIKLVNSFSNEGHHGLVTPLESNVGCFSWVVWKSLSISTLSASNLCSMPLIFSSSSRILWPHLDPIPWRRPTPFCRVLSALRGSWVQP